MSFLMVPRAPITTGTVVDLNPHIRSTSISKSLYLVSFSVVLTEVLVYYYYYYYYYRLCRGFCLLF